MRNIFMLNNFVESYIHIFWHHFVSKEATETFINAKEERPLLTRSISFPVCITRAQL